MSPLALAALQLLQACIGSAVAGAAVWAALRLALARWPALAARRWAWLLPQMMVVAVFAMLLVPQSSKLGVLPAIALPPAIVLSPAEPAHPAAPLDAAPSDSGARAIDAGAAGTIDGAAGAPGGWLPAAALAWSLVYLAGLGLAIARVARVVRTLRGLRRGASELTALDGHAGFGAERSGASGIAVFETDAAVSPMLIGLHRPCLLLPRHLRAFEDEQQQMVIAHELTHLRRRDPLWMAASIALQTLLWFNPVMRKLGERLTWAQELGCDAQVLQGRPQPQRQAYAAALLAQFRLQQNSFGAAMAFGGDQTTTMTERMQLIRSNANPALGAMGHCVVLGALGLALAGGLLLQPAFAWQAATVQAATVQAEVAQEETVQAETAAAPQPAAAWRAPLAKPRVSSFYGVMSPQRQRPHRGIDLAAPTGTPVFASADGVVLVSAKGYRGEAIYGETVELSHGGGMRSLYAHLDRRRVAVGEVVKAGQLIGLSGATGKVSGPHLHFEVRRGSELINPETVLAGLTANATRPALAARLPLPPGK
ncbi:M23/M56 family metallopeptidase [Massilia glaciei]|uniref:Peptidase n=1 Tax=Massilia glaciei TaxID=1524097 RepID=A0A2U2HIZ5_9BURK|nr:M23/M56 family metallopeptidase [Massilia glaciei]PWF46683.1 peptidase [Massilia glaciei]